MTEPLFDLKTFYADRLQAETRTSRRQEWRTTENDRINATILPLVTPRAPRRCTHAEFRDMVLVAMDELNTVLPPLRYTGQDLRQRAQELLDQLIRDSNWSAALGLLLYPHSTVGHYSGRQPVIEKHGRFTFLSTLSCKDRADRTQDKPRKIPVVLDIEDGDLRRVVQHGQLNQCVAAIEPYLSAFGLQGKKAARFLGCTLLLQYLAEEANADPVEAAPRGITQICNCALGHVHRSDQLWAYCHKF